MKILTDCFGYRVRLTDERLAHILEHPEMRGIESEIDLAVGNPKFACLSRSDSDVRLFYSFCAETIGRWQMAHASWLNMQKLMPLSLPRI